MTIPDFSGMTITELLASYSAVLDELRRQKFVRTNNNPTGDYAELIVSTKLGLTTEKNNSVKGFDATDSDRLRYQIKGRRVTAENKSVQLGVIRNLEGKDFDFLVAVVFEADWSVRYAAKIPHQAVAALATFRKHVNGHVMHLRPTVFNHPDVENISSKMAISAQPLETV